MKTVYWKSKNNRCKCGKLITNDAKQCDSCAAKSRQNKKPSNYINGRSSKTYYCIDCGKEISIDSGLYGQGRCKSCAMKNNYKIGKFDNRNISGKKNPFYGKKHTKEALEKMYGKKCYYKNIFMRSSYEISFAQFLELSGIKWQYEPKTFDLGKVTYTPDFYLFEFDRYIEIKGYWRNKAKKKFELFKRKYPNINIKVLAQKELEELGVL